MCVYIYKYTWYVLESRLRVRAHVLDCGEGTVAVGLVLQRLKAAFVQIGSGVSVSDGSFQVVFLWVGPGSTQIIGQIWLSSLSSLTAWNQSYVVCMCLICINMYIYIYVFICF